MNPEQNKTYYNLDIKNLEISKHEKLGVSHSALYYLNRFDDSRGTLIVGEVPEVIPFEIKRYFLVNNVPPLQVRANHAHKICEEFLICIQGSCTITISDGINQSNVILNSPNIGLYLPKMVWLSVYDFNPDATLLVFASSLYDKNDYIEYVLNLCRTGICGLHTMLLFLVAWNVFEVFLYYQIFRFCQR